MGLQPLEVARAAVRNTPARSAETWCARGPIQMRMSARTLILVSN